MKDIFITALALVIVPVALGAGLGLEVYQTTNSITEAIAGGFIGTCLVFLLGALIV